MTSTLGACRNAHVTVAPVNRLDRLAGQALETGQFAGLEGLWQRAALSAVATGHPADPGLADLKSLTERAWTAMPRWPPDAIHDRIGCLRDTHRLAVALRDRPWLERLDACWSAAPAEVDPLTVLRARGEIDLGLGSHGWDTDQAALLAEEGFLVLGAPSDRAWLALAAGDRETARHHLSELDALLATEMLRWQQNPTDGIRMIRTHPGTVLHVEQRALRVLSA